jgi:hypothetical protein
MLFQLLPDNLAVILKGESIMSFRLVCKGLKAQIERFPDFTLRFSKAGAEHVTSDFLLRFKGKITIGSRHCWNLKSGWFNAMIQAIPLGLTVTTIETMDVYPATLRFISQNLAFALSEREKIDGAQEKIAHISLELTTVYSELEKCRWAIDSLQSNCASISMKLNVLHHKEQDSMLKFVSGLEQILKICTIEELEFRYPHAYTCAFHIQHPALKMGDVTI